jgi:hypothetical protein
MRRYLVLAALCLFFAPLSPFVAGARADCEEKLKELDAKLAANPPLGESQLTMIRGLRDSAAMQCGQGRDAIATQMLQGMIDQIDEVTNVPEQTPGLPKAKLTPAYLLGEWCTSWKKSPERIRYVFHADGSYQLGVPAGRGYNLMPERYSLEHFYGRFEKLVAKEKTKFVVENERGYEIVYSRGSCMEQRAR